MVNQLNNLLGLKEELRIECFTWMRHPLTYGTDSVRDGRAASCLPFLFKQTKENQ